MRHKITGREIYIVSIFVVREDGHEPDVALSDKGTSVVDRFGKAERKDPGKRNGRVLRALKKEKN